MNTLSEEPLAHAVPARLVVRWPCLRHWYSG